MSAKDSLGRQFEVYHGTNDSVGPRFLESTYYVHVGTRRAALSRVDPLKWEPDGYLQSDELASGRSRVYRAELRPDARISPTPLSDDQANYMTVRAESRGRGTAPYDVYPYINEYEDPGSTSYLVHPRALTRVRPIGRTPDLLRQEPDYPHKEDLPK